MTSHDDKFEEMVSIVEDPDAGAGSPHHGHHSAAACGAAAEVRLRPLSSSTCHPRRPAPAAPLLEEGSCRRCSACGGSGVCNSASGDAEPREDVDDTASLHKFWHRAGWLVCLLMCQSTSSVILEHFEILITTHPVVIYFLTMLVGAGGNAGGQSTVLVVRRLALLAARGCKGEKISMRQIVGAEVSTGARLAFVLFCASFVRCVVFQVRGHEAVAICLSMLAIVFTSTLIGAALPVLMNRFGIDPAHAGATIQVVMDISGVTLTCIVSCLVLGLPLMGGTHLSASVNGSIPLVHNFDSLTNSRRSLNGFGGEDLAVSTTHLAQGEVTHVAAHLVNYDT
mmetsp:Transcript_81988/g.265612  ORF Transcript_81988/g.265612 Transcript_81988/m.265612 type:complete len:339 (-) Transcript_81988:152-1168(-)|eukprot:CAMPEP_0203908070 /NCGR_PEP_ID=MMETSP0359-20131031/49495_1 /ASSEMBLY_ACC=CAM_ASM_000338 /TAXON_ID=268821 /ORGANISM="Scrippsiella Hangoei, Strain SHTV-5" /LENGTH=338 /DNA_ID=CAMNT_0050832997 /DNA_START=54 /DNA_END=1070 /DNA_ORIENTATION=+